MPSIPTRFPVVVKSGAVSATIYANATGPGGEYRSFVVAYSTGGKRTRRKFASFWDARSEAQRAVVALTNADTEAATMTHRDAELLVRLRAMVAPLEMDVETALERFVEAAGIIGPHRVVEACKTHSRAFPVASPESITVADACDAYSSHLTAQGRSHRHLGDVRVRLGRFVHDHPGANLDSVTTGSLQRWLDGLKTADGSPASPLTRRNFGTVVGGMLAWHRRRGRIAVNPAVDVERPSARTSGDVEHWSPEEARRILDNIGEDARPAFAVSLFAGTRTAEACRLTRADFNPDAGHLVVGGGKSKTASRRLVPLRSNLSAWLAQWLTSPMETPLWPNGERHFILQVTGACERAGVRRLANGARHSYVSFRVAETGDVARTALECGNSPQVVHAHYRGLATTADAEKFFSIRPA